MQENASREVGELNQEQAKSSKNAGEKYIKDAGIVVAARAASHSQQR